jgi:hypothetical protein
LTLPLTFLHHSRVRKTGRIIARALRCAERRAASVALPFEKPKLAVTAVVNEVEDFASALPPNIKGEGDEDAARAEPGD